MEKDSVLFMTDDRVKVAIRVGAFRLKRKVMVGEVRHGRPVDRCSSLHKLTPEILQDVDYFRAIGNPAPLDVKGHGGRDRSDGWNAERGKPLAVGEIIEQIVRVIHGNIAHSKRGNTRAEVDFDRISRSGNHPEKTVCGYPRTVVMGLYRRVGDAYRTGGVDV
jgi:hypothetical protein